MRGRHGSAVHDHVVVLEATRADAVLYCPDGSDLANDRTFLAWPRTGIALFGLGFVVAKVGLIVQADATRLENKDLYSAVGVLVVLSGAALTLVGHLQHVHVWRALDLHREAPRPRWPLTITVTAFGGSLVPCVLIIVST